jgi:hypothetical protein
MGSRSLHVTDTQAAHIVAGKQFFGEALTNEDFEQLCAKIDQLGEEIGERLAILDISYTDMGERPDSSFTVGLHLVSLHEVETIYEPVAVPYAESLRAVERAKALPWDRIQACIPEGELRDGLVEHGDPKLYAVPIGPVAGVAVSFGVLIATGSDPATKVPGLEVQETNAHDDPPHSVYGIDVAFGHVENGKSEPIDLSAAAHRKRQEIVGALVERAEYYVTGHFD